MKLGKFILLFLGLLSILLFAGCSSNASASNFSSKDIKEYELTGVLGDEPCL